MVYCKVYYHTIIGMDDYNLRMGEHWIDTKQLIIDSEYLNNKFNVGLFIFFTFTIF